jgi:hypothetical protein
MDLNRILRMLQPRQEKVIRLYFGLGCQRSHSALEVAAAFEVSSQVIGASRSPMPPAKFGRQPCVPSPRPPAGGWRHDRRRDTVRWQPCPLVTRMVL